MSKRLPGSDTGSADTNLYSSLWSPYPPKVPLSLPFNSVPEMRNSNREISIRNIHFVGINFLLNKFHSNNTQLIPTVKINQLPLLFLGIPWKQSFSRTHESPWYSTMASFFAPFLVARDSDFLSHFYTFVLQLPGPTCAPIFLAHFTHFLEVRRWW